MKRTTLLLMKVALCMLTFSLFARGKVHDDTPPDLTVSKFMDETSLNAIILPTLNCLPADTEVCVNEIVNYAATAVANMTYLWNVTGGTAPPSTGNSINVTWGSVGSGSVSLTVLDPGGDTVKTCSWQVNIHPLPNPVITASFASGCDVEKEGGHTGGPREEEECIKACDSTTIIYSTALNSGSSYQWAVTGAISYTPSSSGNTVSVYWGSVGNGTVGVTETDQYGCSNYTEICVEIIETPTALFTTLPAPVNGVVDICMLSPTLSQTLYFMDQSTAGLNTIANWYWDFGDGSTSVLQHPTHQYTSPGLYDVWLVVENECHCKDSMRLQVMVHPEMGPDISCASTVCAGATETYTTTASCGVYNWVVQGGTINQAPPYGNNISVTWGNNGPGTVTLDVSGCSPQPMCTSPTAVLVPIISPTSTINGPAVVCANTVNSYAVNYLPGCIYSWTISGGSGTIISDTSKSQINIFWPSTSNGGTVTVNYYNPELNCSGQATLNVLVRDTFAISGPTDLCLPATALYSVVTGGTFNWSVKDASGNVFPLSTGGAVNINWSYPPGTYEVIAEDVAAMYCNSPKSLFVTLYGAPPAPTSIVGQDSICPGQSYTYTSSPVLPAYYLAWNVTGGTPVNGTGNSITVAWGSTPPYSIDLYQVNVASPSCSSAVFTKTIYPKTLLTPVITGPAPSCNNVIASYTATPANGEVYNWTVSPSTFGSVISGQGTPNINVQWNNSIGAATLSLFVKGCSDSLVVTKVVNLTAPPPPVIISADSSCEGYVFNFNSGTMGSNYSWNFGDGSTITTTSVSTSHTYTTAGNYNVTLTVNNPAGCLGTSATSKFVIIHPSPTANLTTTDPTDYCTGQTINTTMYINSQPGNTFQWYGPGGPLGTSLFFTANTPGTYYVDVTGPNGCVSQSNSIEIKQNPCSNCNINPGAAISYNYTGPSCNVVNFNGSITNGNIVGWNFNDVNSGSNNTSTSTSPTHTFTQSGYYQVSFTGLFPGTPDSCVLSDIQTIIIPAVADLEWKITGCASGGFLFDFFDKTNTVTPYTVNLWSWSFGGGTPAFSGLQNPSGVLLAPGQQIVSLTITSSAGTVCTVTDTINVPNLPVASFTSVDSVCDGNPVLFNSTSTGSLIEQLWDFGDLSGSLLAPVTERTYDLPGTYTASLTVTDSFGCVSFFSKPVVVTPNTLTASVSVGGPTTFCQGGNVLLAANPGGGTPPYSYLWAPVVATTPFISAILTGNYAVTVSDLKGCLKTSAPVSVVVNEAPSPVIVGKTDYCAGETVELSANLGASNSYVWFVNGVNSVGPDLTYPTDFFTPPVLNVYVIATGPNGCSDTSAVTQVNVHPLPLFPSISANSMLLCAGTPITLTASNSQGLTQYSWNTGQTGPVITVQQGGTYTATVYNQYGCSAENNITINDLPDLSNLMTGCYDFCDTAGVTWVGPAGHASYQWFQNGFPLIGETQANIYIPAGASGTYTLEVISFYGCKITSGPIDINFVPCAPCNAGSIIHTIKCGPVDSNGLQTYTINMSLYNPYGFPATYTLSTPLGYMSGLMPSVLNPGFTGVNGLFTYVAPFDATIPLCLHGTIISEDGQECTFDICTPVPPCSDTCEIFAGFDFNQVDPCTFDFSNYSWAPGNVTIYDWYWDFGDGTTLSGVQSPTHTYTSNGFFQVCMTVYGTNGTDTCSQTICWDVLTVGCETDPCDIHPVFNLSQIDPCTFKFTDYSTAPAGVTIYDWSWDFGDGTTLSGVQNPTHTYTGNGFYMVCLTVYATNGTDTCSVVFCMDVFVNNCKPGPCKLNAAFDFGQIDPCTFQFTDYSTAPTGVSIYNWFWDFGDGTTLSGVQNPSHTYLADGFYTVCVTIYGYNGTVFCQRKICMDIFVSGCGTPPPPDDATQMQAWPNPSDGTYFLNIETAYVTRDNIRVVNAMGSEVPFDFGEEKGVAFIRLLTDEPGLYLITLQKEDTLMRTTVLKR